MSGSDPAAPRAIRLDTVTETPLTARAVSVVAETEPFEDMSVATPVRPASRRMGWLGILGSAISGLVVLSLGLWVERTVIDLLGIYPVLGYFALGLALVALVALFILLGRMVRDILHERRIEGIRASAERLLVGGSADEARSLAGEISTLYAKRPQTAAGRAALTAALPDLFATRDVLSVAERTLMLALDERAKSEIARAARQVSLVTAVSPRAIVDIAFVLVACTRLLRAIATAYGGRPGLLGMLRLGRAVFTHLIVTGGMAAGDALIQQVLGQGLAARLSAKLGEGVLNGLLTARVGLAAIAVCRPLPFIDASPPTLTDVAGDLVSWRSKGADEA